MARAQARTSPPRPSTRRSTRGRRYIRWAVVVFAVIVMIDAIVGDRGLLAMLRARGQYEASEAALERQKAENDRLREEIDRLTNDPAALEELARGELGLMRPGEKVFIIKDLEPPAAH